MWVVAWCALLFLARPFGLLAPSFRHLTHFELCARSQKQTPKRNSDGPPRTRHEQQGGSDSKRAGGSSPDPKQTAGPGVMPRECYTACCDVYSRQLLHVGLVIPTCITIFYVNVYRIDISRQREVKKCTCIVECRSRTNPMYRCR